MERERQTSNDTREMKHVRLGPWGGSSEGAIPWEFIPNGKITKIYIRTGGNGGCIDSIAFDYTDANTGKKRRSDTYGGKNGHLSESMYLETDEEIIEFSGYVGHYDGWKVITSLAFRTNEKWCQYGSLSGYKFSLPLDARTATFAGFHGRYGAYLESIGAIFVPK